MSQNKENRKEHYFISAGGTRVEVTEAVYRCYYQSERRMRYYEWDIKAETSVFDENKMLIGLAPGKEDSFDRLIDKGEEFEAEQESVEDEALRRVMSDELHAALDKLPSGERSIIDALYFSNDGAGMTEREYSAKYSIPQQTVNDRKRRIAKKLKSFFIKNPVKPPLPMERK